MPWITYRFLDKDWRWGSSFWCFDSIGRRMDQPISPQDAIQIWNCVQNLRCNVSIDRCRLFNDSFSRTFLDVVDGFDRCAFVVALQFLIFFRNVEFRHVRRRFRFRRRSRFSERMFFRRRNGNAGIKGGRRAGRSSSGRGSSNA